MDEFSVRLGQALRQMYNQLAKAESGLLKPVAIDRGLVLLKKLGYPVEILKSLPPENFAHAFPLANPLPQITGLKPTSILDLGCGTALDLLFCTRLLPQLESAYGLDASSELLDLGRKRLEYFPDSTAKIRLLETDLNLLEQTELPLFDLILMNGSFNLIHNKDRLFRRLAELLNDKGRILIYDFLLTESLPPGFADEIDNWLWNIGGALNAAELEITVKNNGLAIVSVDELERINPVARCEISITKTIPAA